MDGKHIDQVIEGKLVKLGYSFPERWQKRYYDSYTSGIINEQLTLKNSIDFLD